MFTNSGIHIYRAIVVRSSTATGEVLVKVPELMGDQDFLRVSKDFINETDAGWAVPSEGSQIIIGIEGERARNVYIISMLKEQVINSDNQQSLTFP